MSVVKVGNVTIPIDRWGDGRYWIRWREDGKPRQRPYTTIEKAKVCARLIATRLANNQPILSDISASDREIYLSAKALTQKFGVSLPNALDEWAQKVANRQSDPIPKIVAQLLLSKSDHKLSPRYMRGLRGDLEAFARAFPGEISNVSALEIENYLRGLGLGDRRRNNVRDEIVTLFLFAKEHGQLPSDRITQAEKVKRIKLEDGAPRIYTPEFDRKKQVVRTSAKKRRIAKADVERFSVGRTPNPNYRSDFQNEAGSICDDKRHAFCLGWSSRRRNWTCLHLRSTRSRN
jgi:hypothetical protein